MKPLLASLVLLLLALCRPSTSVSWSSVSTNTKSSTSSVAFSSPKQKEQVLSNTASVGSLDAPAKEEQLLSLMGNTIFTIVLILTKVYENLPHNIQVSFLNGVLCEVNDELAGKVKLIQGDIRAKEEIEAVKYFLDCKQPSTAPRWTCFCNEMKPFVYCQTFAVKELLKGATPGKCRKEALEALKAAGQGALGKQYDLDSFEKNSYSEFFSGKDVNAVTKNENAEMAKIYCDALNPTVEQAVKDLYAADALYWISESILYTIVFGSPEKSLTDICKEDAFKNNEYGKCVCSMDTGFTYCIYKVLGKVFKDTGYITCDVAAEAFVPAKKPEALPQLVHKNAAIAASSLMMVPLMAAAVLLARH